jgi:hypothetical protein
MDKCLTEQQIIDESTRLIESLKWNLTEEGVDYHFIDKNTSSNYGIVAGMLEDLVNDARNVNNLNPAYVIGYLALRLWGQNPVLRDDIEKVFNLNGLDHLEPYLPLSSSG